MKTKLVILGDDVLAAMATRAIEDDRTVSFECVVPRALSNASADVVMVPDESTDGGERRWTIVEGDPRLRGQLELTSVEGTLETLLRNLQGRGQDLVSATGGDVVYRKHRVMNQLSALLAGLRALGIELREKAVETQGIDELVDEYIDPLASLVRELGVVLSRAPEERPDEPRSS